MEDHRIVEYQCLREEINIRLQQHSRVVIYKFIGLGATLAFFGSELANSSSADGNAIRLLYYAWMLPLIMSIFDTMIAGNLRTIRRLGDFIRDKVEPYFASKTSCEANSFWENAFAGGGQDKLCFSYGDVFPISLLTFLSIAVVGFAVFKESSSIWLTVVPALVCVGFWARSLNALGDSVTLRNDENRGVSWVRMVLNRKN